ncbi:MAG: peptidoglycan-binding protein [Candidatus Saccharimonadales bacterium]
MITTIKQLRSANLTIATQLGWCLRDVRRAYGISDSYAKYRNARAAWDASKTKHYGIYDLPKIDVLIPVWIRYGAISTNDHVMLYNPKTGVFYSDDNNTGRFVAYKNYTAWANRVQDYKPTILGWTEDVENVRVLEVSGADVTTELPARGYWKLNDKGDIIGRITAFMRKNYPAYTNAKALGPVYGPYAVASITEFQKRTGLKADGFIGPITLAKLKGYGFGG